MKVSALTAQYQIKGSELPQKVLRQQGQLQEPDVQVRYAANNQSQQLLVQPDLWHQSAGFSERLPWPYLTESFRHGDL